MRSFILLLLLGVFVSGCVTADENVLQTTRLEDEPRLYSYAKYLSCVDGYVTREVEQNSIIAEPALIEAGISRCSKEFNEYQSIVFSEIKRKNRVKGDFDPIVVETLNERLRQSTIEFLLPIIRDQDR
jgi:hypothetical protein